MFSGAILELMYSLTKGGNTMRSLSTRMFVVVGIIVMGLACFANGGEMMAGAPPITPEEFQTASPKASWLWSLFAQEDVVAIVLSAGAAIYGYLLRNRQVKRLRLEKALEFLAAGTRETYEEYVRHIQKALENDGKLSEEERRQAMAMTIEKATTYCKQNGFDLLKVFAKEYLPVIVEWVIGRQKAIGRGFPFPPRLPDLEPR